MRVGQIEWIVTISLYNQYHNNLFNNILCFIFEMSCGVSQLLARIIIDCAKTK